MQPVKSPEAGLWQSCTHLLQAGGALICEGATEEMLQLDIRKDTVLFASIINACENNWKPALSILELLVRRNAVSFTLQVAHPTLFYLSYSV